MVVSLQLFLVPRLPLFKKDDKAKFGTVVNGNALSALSIVSLQYGDEIKLGLVPGTGSFRWAFICVIDILCIVLHYNICTSCVNHILPVV